MSARILLVEDDQLNRFALQKLLEKSGYAVIEAEDGQRALELLEQETVDCILMDVQLPVLNGVEATQTIRAHDGSRYNPEVPIIALTAYAMPGDREKFLDFGMNDYLAKPTTIEQLEVVLRKYVAAGA
ncbi:response regulator [Desulfonatronum thioautotrophicum]|uniref:response regulator n=1 Tax=Desulfonatronum thioautotrophicum TaxID=617001 RepID=UPI0005EBD39D|nr:response regulator [Desulfonatronum thioautotrophicum]